MNHFFSFPNYRLLVICTLFFLFCAGAVFSVSAAEDEITPPDPSSLHALSACLMDADSGRILYAKEADVLRANASTTKILTCILALEYGNPDDLVTVSKYAASMPDVQLNINTGETYRLKDLLYSLMLESHNDTAVAIAEHIGGDTKHFAEMMNEKAAELGCTESHFITPNGLDAADKTENGEQIHGTTAKELCKIMAYCIKNPDFLTITQTDTYSFTNYVTEDDGTIRPGNRAFTVNNKNAFLHMMEGVISGKTGFTGNAGYCYVCALKRDDKTMTLTLLGCGWPHNKHYKWEDAKTLLQYGIDAYTIKNLQDPALSFPDIPVEDGILKTSDPALLNADKTPLAKLVVSNPPLPYPVCASDTLTISSQYKKKLHAPAKAGDAVGTVTYRLNGEIIRQSPILIKNSVEKITFLHCLRGIFRKFCL